MNPYRKKKNRTLAQGMTEYMIIIALISIASIVLVSKLGNNTRKVMGNANKVLAGGQSSNNYERTDSKDIKQYGLKNFHKGELSQDTD